MQRQGYVLRDTQAGVGRYRLRFHILRFDILRVDKLGLDCLYCPRRALAQPRYSGVGKTLILECRCQQKGLGLSTPDVFVSFHRHWY